MFSFLRPQGANGPRVQHIGPTEAVSRAAKGEITVIDVRDGNEIKATGHAKGALLIPLAALRMKCDPQSPEFVKGLSVEKPVALYCASGARSQAAGQQLIGFGFKEVYNIGGLRDWQQGGGHITR